MNWHHKEPEPLLSLCEEPKRDYVYISYLPDFNSVENMMSIIEYYHCAGEAQKQRWCQLTETTSYFCIIGQLWVHYFWKANFQLTQMSVRLLPKDFYFLDKE